MFGVLKSCQEESGIFLFPSSGWRMEANILFCTYIINGYLLGCLIYDAVWFIFLKILGWSDAYDKIHADYQSSNMMEKEYIYFY